MEQDRKTEEYYYICQFKISHQEYVIPTKYSQSTMQMQHIWVPKTLIQPKPTPHKDAPRLLSRQRRRGVKCDDEHKRISRHLFKLIYNEDEQQLLQQLNSLLLHTTRLLAGSRPLHPRSLWPLLRSLQY